MLKHFLIFYFFNERNLKSNSNMKIKHWINISLESLEKKEANTYKTKLECIQKWSNLCTGKNKIDKEIATLKKTLSTCKSTSNLCETRHEKNIQMEWNKNEMLIVLGINIYVQDPNHHVINLEVLLDAYLD